MDNFEIHQEATYLSDVMSSYQLAKLFIKTRQELEEFKQKLGEQTENEKKAETSLQGTKEV